jgi:hypothetical protein
MGSLAEYPGILYCSGLVVVEEHATGRGDSPKRLWRSDRIAACVGLVSRSRSRLASEWVLAAGGPP